MPAAALLSSTVSVSANKLLPTNHRPEALLSFRISEPIVERQPFAADFPLFVGRDGKGRRRIIRRAGDRHGIARPIGGRHRVLAAGKIS